MFNILQPRKPFSLKSGGWGAWELAVRYSGLHLSDKTVRGGEIDDLTFGLNGYPNAYGASAPNFCPVYIESFHS